MRGSRDGLSSALGEMLTGKKDFEDMLTNFRSGCLGRRAGADLLRAVKAAGVVVALAIGWRAG